jgi:uncharacterized protein YacL
MVALSLSATIIYAADGAPGNAELNLLTTIFTGNIGLVIGLVIAITGIIQFVKGDSGAAIYTIVLGVLITLLPGVYNGLRMIACTLVESLGQCGGSGS